MFVLTTGRMDKDCPVQANRALRCATIQSTVPSRFNTVKEPLGVLVDNNKVRGLAEEIFTENQRL